MSDPRTIRTLAILAFHKIGDPPAAGWDTWFYIPEATFVAQLRYLKETGWTVIGLRRFLDGLGSLASLPGQAALLTFDDGYRSMRHVALPVLRRFGYPALLFVPTDFIGGQNSFDAENEPDEPICDWEDLSSLEAEGVSVQSHGKSHRPFSMLRPHERAEELLKSKTVLEEGLVRPVEVFAFPYGDGGPDAEVSRRELKAAGYRAAFGYGGEGIFSVPIDDAYRLSRIAMGPDTDLGSALQRSPRG